MKNSTATAENARWTPISVVNRAKALASRYHHKRVTTQSDLLHFLAINAVHATYERSTDPLDVALREALRTVGLLIYRAEDIASAANGSNCLHAARYWVDRLDWPNPDTAGLMQDLKANIRY